MFITALSPGQQSQTAATYAIRFSEPNMFIYPTISIGNDEISMWEELWVVERGEVLKTTKPDSIVNGPDTGYSKPSPLINNSTPTWELVAMQT